MQRTRATAEVSVDHSEDVAFDEAAKPVLKVVSIEETFTGDLTGDSSVRALQMLNADGSATMISLQRFRGRLGERAGTFVLEGRETVKDKKIEATWSVVPGSGTGALAGLRGEGGFTGELGKGSHGTLDYWFDEP